MALPRLAAGEPVTRIALDLGYESPGAFATMFRRQLGEQCENVELIDYLHRWPDPQLILHLMVGDMQRIMVYPERGFQCRQNVPEDVRVAHEALIALGFDKHLP
ncbi:helix-turn-helix domain-containing protein [Halomonas elongata]|uniref:helix-turn-helix domain-containing protein n=1 Tax=Halomonas elongata TaxID=2746 RepID=UPI0023AF869B|nr:helix-turn-helix domain-containing protein [Halomonas elongata]